MLEVAFSLRPFTARNAVDCRNMPSTAVDHDRTCANAGRERSQKSNIESVLRLSTACSMLYFETVPHVRTRSIAVDRRRRQVTIVDSCSKNGGTEWRQHHARQPISSVAAKRISWTRVRETINILERETSALITPDLWPPKSHDWIHLRPK